MITSRLLALGLGLCAVAPAAAWADQPGNAPVRAPDISLAKHVSFALDAQGWMQVAGATSGTPSLGAYAVDVPSNAGHCRLTATVGALTTRVRPQVQGRAVTLRPGARPLTGPFRYDYHGRHGTVTWWSGTQKNADAVAGGVQRAPASLAGPGRRWVVYQAQVTHTVTGTPRTGDCDSYARQEAPKVALRIAKTMHLANGAPTAQVS